MWLPSALILCAFFQASLQFTSDSLKVKLDHGGTLVGRHLTTIHGRHIRAFQGVPYALPPTGVLRFKAPVPHPSWEGEKLVIQNSPMCIQLDPFTRSTQVAGTEDCLYLNVYTPPLENIANKGPLPVMVWFHGGGWESGLAGDQLYGPKFLLDKNVILVSGSYRLGIMGFLSTESLDCPGNFGLKDQTEVLRWVNKNIKSFGGDPNSVTIFGESAGGGSVTYLMYSEQSNKLFNRVISQSGTTFNPWALQLKDGRALARTKQLAEYTGCQKGSLSEIMSCLRRVPAEVIVSRFFDFFDWDIFPSIPFAPVIEQDHPDAFLTSDPKKTEQRSLEKPLMIGLTSHEGVFFSATFLSSANLRETIRSQYRHLFPIIFHYDHLEQYEQDSITDAIDSFYFKNGHDYNLANHGNFTDLITDAFFTSGIDEFLRTRLPYATAPTYTYVFDHLGSGSASEYFGGGDLKLGVCHADELQYLFSWGVVLPTTVPTKRDVAIREAMVEMWTNFAIHGNPTPSSGSLPKWNPTKKYDKWNYARIGSSTGDESYLIQNEKNFAPERIAFWKKWDPIFGGPGKVSRNEL